MTGTSLRLLKAIACLVPAWMKRKKRSANISSPMVSKKPRTIKCSRREGKSSSRRGKLLEFNCGRESSSRGGRANSGRFIAQCPFAFALSRSPRFHDETFRESPPERLRRQIDAGREPTQMASGPHHLVLRNIHPEKMDPGL